MPTTLPPKQNYQQIEINWLDNNTPFQNPEKINGEPRTYAGRYANIKDRASTTIVSNYSTAAGPMGKIATSDMTEQRSEVIPGFRATRSELKQLRVTDSLPVILGDLQSYENDNDQYDEDYLKPTQYAFTTARTLLQGARIVTHPYFPLGTLYPDGDGGIRIEWMRPDREISLVIGASQSEPSYIFRKEGQRYKGDYEITPERLGDHLSWLNQDERSSRANFPMGAIA